MTGEYCKSMVYNQTLFLTTLSKYNTHNGMEKVLKICKLKLMTNDYTENMYDFFFPYGTISWKNNVLLLNFC
jgi:hypothetical protein